MDDLVEFLRARYDEDAEAARKAAEGHGGTPAWRPEVLADPDYPAQPVLHIGDRTILAGLPGDEDPFRADELVHIARHDPARILREIDAKRRALDHYEEFRGFAKGGTAPFRLAAGAVAMQIQIMALPYGDHPDYREDWRP
ncbi:DUF6221 family protein [Streptomyces sp. NPDC058280]|uniref:DUF6221 family protein n=1 Tax=Streptomyces sp. NPDC058280 TaxID=3346419 RepID=UPI0036EBA751